MGNTRRGRSTALRGTGGFTLAETLIATAISGVILVGLYLVYDVNQITFIKGEQLADLQQNARIGMDRIAREPRAAGCDPQAAPPDLIAPRRLPLFQEATWETSGGSRSPSRHKMPRPAAPHSPSPCGPKCVPGTCDDGASRGPIVLHSQPLSGILTVPLIGQRRRVG